MDTTQLIGRCKAYFGRLGYAEKRPNGLLNPEYPDTYNPCSGHAEITELANSPELEEAVKWTALEPVFRHIDAQKVGVSRYHSSFFEMLTYVDSRKSTESSKEKIILEQVGLYKELGINVEELHVTTFGGCLLLGKDIPADEEATRILIKLLGKNKVHPLRSTSNIEFWPQEREQAGSRCEFFLERGEELFEIGTVVFDDHIYRKGSLRRIPNSVYGGAGGIERLEMAVNGYSSIRDVGTIKPISDMVRQYSQAGNLKFLEDEVFTASDALKSALLIMAEGQEKTNKTRRGQRLSRLINDARRALQRLNIQNYSRLLSEIALFLIYSYGERYSFYKHIDSENLFGGLENSH